MAGNDNGGEIEKHTKFFAFQRDWIVSLKTLDAETCAELTRLTFDYFIQDEVRDIESLGINDRIVKFVFAGIKEQIDASIIAYRKQREGGHNGGSVPRKK